MYTVALLDIHILTLATPLVCVTAMEVCGSDVAILLTWLILASYTPVSKCILTQHLKYSAVNCTQPPS